MKWLASGELTRDVTGRTSRGRLGLVRQVGHCQAATPHSTLNSDQNAAVIKFKLFPLFGFLNNTGKSQFLCTIQHIFDVSKIPREYPCFLFLVKLRRQKFKENIQFLGGGGCSRRGNQKKSDFGLIQEWEGLFRGGGLFRLICTVLI